MIDPKQIRKRLGLTQAQMASACNVQLSYWAKWEYGERRPSAAAERLLELLVDLSDANQFEDYLKKYMDEKETVNG